MKPSDLSLPFDSFRPGQWEAIDKAGRMGLGEVFILEAPTGFGKSALPAALAQMGYTVTALVATTGLQRQYASSFEDAAIVWGKRNYECVNGEFVQEFRERYGWEPSVEDCASVREGAMCQFCPYVEAVNKAKLSRFRVLNYHYAFWTDWWHSSHFIVLDEAHQLEDLLRQLIQVRVREERVRAWQLPDLVDLRGTGRDCELASSWLLGAHHQAGTFLRTNRTWLEPTVISAIQRWIQRSRQLSDNMLSRPDDYYVESDMDAFTVRPIDISFYAPIFARPAPRKVLMSATIGDPAVMATTLGLGQEFQFDSLPHPIPAEQRRVYLVKGAPKMSRKTYSDAITPQVQLLEQVVRRHPDEKGLVLTSSWSHAVDLKAYSLMELYRRISLPPRGLRQSEQVDWFINSPPGTVCISPGFWEGLDLHDDLCRFVVTAKVPFPDLSDPVVKLLLRRPGGRAWYDNKAAVKIVQGHGRAVRHEEDWATGYILDGWWERVSRYAPKWFNVEEIGL